MGDLAALVRLDISSFIFNGLMNDDVSHVIRLVEADFPHNVLGALLPLGLILVNHRGILDFLRRKDIAMNLLSSKSYRSI